MKEHTGLALPAWLNGQTAALVGTVLTVGVAIGAMVLASSSGIRSEMQDMRKELRGEMQDTRKELGAEIRTLDNRLRSVEVDVAAIHASVVGLDARVRANEVHARHPVESAHGVARRSDG